MMEALQRYILSVISAALICGVLSGLVSQGGGKDLIRLLGGLFLAAVILRPISRLDIELLTDFSYPYILDAEEAAAYGEKMAHEAAAEIIKDKSEAYILDKAAQWNAELEVTVAVSEAGIPVSAELYGTVSPYARQTLSSILETDLGITKENQIWTG